MFAVFQKTIFCFILSLINVRQFAENILLLWTNLQQLKEVQITYVHIYLYIHFVPALYSYSEIDIVRIRCSMIKNTFCYFIFGQSFHLDNLKYSIINLQVHENFYYYHSKMLDFEFVCIIILSNIDCMHFHWAQFDI